MDVAKLAKIGFTTEFGRGFSKQLRTTSDIVQSESANAFTMADLFTTIGFHRISSMLTLLRALPGYLAAMTSSEDSAFNYGLCMLRMDF